MQRKSKPKFELPAETESVTPEVGWVYRETRDTTQLAVMLPPQGKTSTRRSPAADVAQFALKAGIGALGVGIMATGVTSLGVLSVISSPVLIAGRFFDHRD